MGKEEGRKGVNAVYDNVTAGLQNIYKNKLLPLEKEYNFHDFHSPKLEVRTFFCPHVEADLSEICRFILRSRLPNMNYQFVVTFTDITKRCRYLADFSFRL